VKRLVFFVVLIIIWVMLTWSYDSQTLLAGLVLSVVLAAILGSIYAEEPKRVFEPVRWLWFIMYIFYFIYYCVKANLDVAYRVLHPDVPIRPGIVKVRTDLKTDIAKTFLANSITLTPGTLTVDIKDQDFYVHWINITTDDPEEQTEIIIKRFERILSRIFE